MRRRSILVGMMGLAFAAGVGGWVLSGGVAEAGPVYSGRDDGVAIKGADPVAYFELGRPVEGKAEHAVRWNGAEWRFANAEHKALFEADPERYAPQYGGFCAFAAANGQKAKIEPEAWSIVDGKLYLNYDLPIRKRWEANRDDFIQAADEKWPEIAAQ